MVPAKDVPPGLTADEYLKLSIQYLLMNWKKQMVIAAKKAMEGGNPMKKHKVEGLSDEEYKKLGMMLGIVETTMEIGDQANEVVRGAFDAMQQAANFADQALNEFEPITEVKNEVQNALKWWTEQATEAINKAVEEILLPVLGLPTRDVPEGMSADEYLRIANQYKSMGWTEQARDALLMANEIDPQDVGPKALRYLKTKIPRHPVPHHAVKKNIWGHSLFLRGELDEAKKTFEELIQNYPDFEWPYGNLGAVYIQQGKISNAKDVLSKAIDINGDYLNAWLHLARARAAVLEVREAQSCIDKAMRLDPDDQAVQSLKTLIEFLSQI
ncbi:MAG: tetratricopeptide repeat protein [Cyanobacteria bacterium SZAS-4]|nr:tetratricopeptide repeat protein [Cyanobacteria bacterium SZAS-4]